MEKQNGQHVLAYSLVLAVLEYTPDFFATHYLFGLDPGGVFILVCVWSGVWAIGSTLLGGPRRPRKPKNRKRRRKKKPEPTTPETPNTETPTTTPGTSPTEPAVKPERWGS